jgi:hypothetical protein
MDKETKTQYAIICGDDLMPQYSRVFDTLVEAAQCTTAGEYVVALEDGWPRPLSIKEEEDYSLYKVFRPSCADLTSKVSR